MIVLVQTSIVLALTLMVIIVVSVLDVRRNKKKNEEREEKLKQIEDVSKSLPPENGQVISIKNTSPRMKKAPKG